MSKKLGELGIRYAVFVSGYTSHKVFGGGGGFRAERGTSLQASVWDLKSAELAGTLQASASGTLIIGVAVIVPIFNPAPTESLSCENIANELAKFLGNGPSQGK